jgi:RNA polymerase sigma factor (TIGR02999 family)
VGGFRAGLVYTLPMGADPAANVTLMLSRAAAGDAGATDELFPVVYEELRRLASGLLAREAPGHTLQPTALVNEAYLRLVGPADLTWQSRAHFFGSAAQAMRRILIDRARQVQARRRREVAVAGPAARMDGLTELPGLDSRTVSTAPEELLDLDDAMERLRERDARQHEVVMLRFFAGLTVEQTAELLGVSAATVKNDWAFARAWLNAEVRRRSAGRGGA